MYYVNIYIYIYSYTFSCHFLNVKDPHTGRQCGAGKWLSELTKQSGFPSILS